MSPDLFAESILHPTDFSASSARAFAHALGLSILARCHLTLLHVGTEDPGEIDWSRFPAVRKLLERWGMLPPGSHQTDVFERLGVGIEKVALRSRRRVAATADFLKQQPRDLVVLATAGRQGPMRWLQPSVAEGIARWSGAKTLFVPSRATRNLIHLRDGSPALHNVLIPVDHSPAPQEAVRATHRATELLGVDPVSVSLLHIGRDAPTVQTPAGSRATWRTERRDGDVVEQILDAAQQQAGLVVMATAGREGPLEALRGSTTEQVLRRLTCPLLAVPADG